MGTHPSRAWYDEEFATERLNYLRLEYKKCPIHVAVLNGQLKILTLIAKLNVNMLEQRDGFELAPWRLSLRNTHKDPAKNLAQKDVARFLLAKAFSGKVDIVDTTVHSATTTPYAKISIHLYYKIKNWVERARARVYFVYGISKSSYKKRPFNKGGLCGNKVLVDGYNNNFREYGNAYERLRARYKHYYFYSDEDRDKNGYPDLYFKTVLLFFSFLFFFSLFRFLCLSV